MFGQPLFRDAELETYLRQRDGLIDTRIAKHVDAGDLGKSEREIVARELKQAIVKPLNVDFDDPTNEITHGRITTADNFYGRVEIKGVCATRSYPFTGEPSLFGMRPVQWVGSARGEILHDNIVIGAEGSKDSDGLRRELDEQEAVLREYVAHSAAQVEAHNAALAEKIADAVARRLGHLREVESFRRKIVAAS